MHVAHRVYPMVLGNSMNSHRLFLNRLMSKMNLQEVNSENNSDVIIAFVAIVSRAGTDIQAALEKIPRHSYKHIILVSLHHTFDPLYVAPDSRYSVHRKDVFAVDCLYHEDQGLLNCRSNDEALQRVITHLGGEKTSAQVSEPSWLSDVDITKPTFWILFTLIIFFAYLVLPAGYSFVGVLIYEIILLIIITVVLNYYSCSKWTFWIFCIMTLFILLILKIHYFINQTLKAKDPDSTESL